LRKRFFTFFFFVFGIMLFVSCSDNYSTSPDNLMISFNDEEKSHRHGENCMDCHSTGQSEKHEFNIAGSVFTDNGESPVVNGLVKFYEEPKGEGRLVYAVEIDAKGNFFSTEGIEVEEGVYPAIESTTGNMYFMLTEVETGACSNCHSQSGIKLVIN